VTRRGGVLLALALGLAVALGVYLSTRADPAPPFSATSTAPDGYGAVALLLEQQGATVESVLPVDLLEREEPLDDTTAIVVPVPSALDVAQTRLLEERLQDGAVVVHGEPSLDGSSGELDPEELRSSALDEMAFLSSRALADTPAMPVQPGACDIAELADLGPIDAAFSLGMVEDPTERSCYRDTTGVFVRQADRGRGTLVTLASPLLWANARLQPAKEEGGQPLANGATAVRLLQGASTVVFVDPVRAAGAPRTGSQDPVSLLPLPVKLALVQLAAAFGLYVWWRARRLGRPVAERRPVDIAGSELVVAVGDLLRRRGNAERAASVVRADAVRVLAQRLGMGPNPDPGALVRIVAQRCGREPAEVGDALYGGPSATVTDAESLVRLVQTLDRIRQEVLDVPAPV
jgi:hypothetical protein